MQTVNASQPSPYATKRVVILAMLFVSVLIVSNLTAVKVAELHFGNKTLDFPAALLFFPLTYFFDNALTEVYGFKMSRLILWGGVACSALITLSTTFAVYLPASPQWDLQTNHGELAYQFVFTSSLRIFFASLIAYFFGEFSNSILLAKLKVWTHGRYLFLRVVSSTAIGALIDAIIFIHLAFGGILPVASLWQMIGLQYVFKVGYEVIMLPVTYYLINYLKKKDQIDYYDIHTKFTPFSFSLQDK